jgi:hypothetical protein
MMIMSTAGYAALAVKMELDEMATVEKTQIKAFAKNCAIADKDAKHSLFIPKERFGCGYKNAIVEQLKGIAREAEVTLNDRADYAACVRSRLQAARTANSSTRATENLVTHAAKTLGAHGIYLRDGGEAFTSRMLDVLAQKDSQRHRALGEKPVGAPCMLYDSEEEAEDEEETE